MAVYSENQGADGRSSENKDLTPNKRINVSSIFGLLNRTLKGVEGWDVNDKGTMGR